MNLPSDHPGLLFSRDLFEGKITKESLKVIAILMHCPHCNQNLRVIDVAPTAQEGINPWSKQPDQWIAIQLSDGYWARMWKTEPSADAAQTH